MITVITLIFPFELVTLNIYVPFLVAVKVKFIALVSSALCTSPFGSKTVDTPVPVIVISKLFTVYFTSSSVNLSVIV